MMYWNKNPDGSMTRKLMQDWNEEEKALHSRHRAFLKEAEALGYVFSLNCDTLKWVGRFAPRTWVGLTEDEVSEIIDAEIGFNSCWGPEEAFARAIEAKLKEKNRG